ncbi:MAG: 3'-5' exonuclease [Kiritimatiellae bacterium]|nr:3'-5' exonuclease [Kiritimatiellia bacterium]
MILSADTRLRDLTFTVLDFETTGTVKGFISLPWQLGAVLIRNQTLTLSEGNFDTLLHVPDDYPFSKHAPGNHANRRTAIADAPDFSDIWPLLNTQLTETIPVAHNAATERTLLARVAPMTHYPIWIDTLHLTRKIYPSLPSFTLENILAALGLGENVNLLVPGRKAHDAYYDAVACATLLLHILSLPGWANLTLEQLNQL